MGKKESDWSRRNGLLKLVWQWSFQRVAFQIANIFLISRIVSNGGALTHTPVQRDVEKRAWERTGSLQ